MIQVLGIIAFFGGAFIGTLRAIGKIRGDQPRQPPPVPTTAAERKAAERWRMD